MNEGRIEWETSWTSVFCERCAETNNSAADGRWRRTGNRGRRSRSADGAGPRRARRARRRRRPGRLLTPHVEVEENSFLQIYFFHHLI